jgi:curli biogenesis system outer membrane secretion channel CsgG
MMTPRTRTIPLVIVLAGLVLAACSSSKSSSTATTVAPAATTTSAAGPSQNITITPSTGLHDGQTVRIVGTGYTKSGEQLQVTECADKGQATGAGDCDLRNIKA